MSKCPPGKIVNPQTDRCVSIDGKIGQLIVNSVKSNTKSEKNEYIDISKLKLQKIIKRADSVELFFEEEVLPTDSLVLIIIQFVNEVFHELVVNYNKKKLTTFKQFLSPLFVGKNGEELENLSLRLVYARIFDKTLILDHNKFTFPTVKGVPKTFDCNKAVNVFMKELVTSLIWDLGSSRKYQSYVSEYEFNGIARKSLFFKNAVKLTKSKNIE